MQLWKAEGAFMTWVGDLILGLGLSPLSFLAGKRLMLAVGTRMRA